MSYDFEFKKYENGELVNASTFYLGVTSNLKRMFNAIRGDCDVNKVYKATELMPVLTKGIEMLTNDPDKYRLLEPANRWGTVENAIEILSMVLAEYVRIQMPKDELYFTI